MKDKIIAFFQNEKIRGFNKRVFNKKTFTGVVILLVLGAALRIAFSFMFEVQGVVKKIDGSKITVVNFVTSKTVDIGDFPTVTSEIIVGDRIEIMKNLSGEIINVRDESKNRMSENDDSHNNDKRNFKGNDEHKSKERH